MWTLGDVALGVVPHQLGCTRDVDYTARPLDALAAGAAASGRPAAAAGGGCTASSLVF